jgi:hypothetical protein
MSVPDFDRIREDWREQRITAFEALERILKLAEDLTTNDELLNALWRAQDIITAMRAQNGKQFLAQGITDSTLKEEYRPKPDADV